jgi:hypothetical protein
MNTQQSNHSGHATTNYTTTTVDFDDVQDDGDDDR